ncbi:tubulin-folding cofactor B [Pterulicium gracile]|uniref:Tubulin-folding cofactor B n=1 Tax=Pterulicium gracile TaxID=1884261 RepID=A0A5C3QUX9_9AGAR|nr:tubulin-folding cofactor B [Pterula gracilis]
MSSALNIWVRSPDTRSERRFERHVTVANLKAKLELITGVPAQNQRLWLHNSESEDAPIAELADDEKMLGFYATRDFQMIKVEDTNPSTSFTGQLTDVSQVEKFEMTDVEYAQRSDTVMAYKSRHKMGRFADKSTEEDGQTEAQTQKVDIPVGSRCQVESNEPGLSKRGTVRFVGPTKFAPAGVWVGIEYDEPMGKNDGTVQGEQYFTCKSNYGVFVRPDRVQVGDFPEEDLLEEM